MPSLSALKQFKTSFNDIGGEKADFISKNIPFDDLEFPDFEPEPMNMGGAAADPLDGGLDFDAPAGFGDEVAVPDILGDLPPAGDFNLDDLGSLGLNLDGTDAPPAPDADFAIPDLDMTGGADSPEAGGDDFSTPDALLSGLSGELENTPPDFPEEAAPAPGMDFDAGALGLDLGGDTAGLDDFAIPDLDMPSSDTEAAPGLEPDAGLDLGGDTGLDLGGDAADFDLGGDATGLDLGDMSGLDMGGETPEELSGDESLDMGGDAGLDLGGDAAGFDLGGDAAGFDMGGEEAALAGDDFDQFSLGGEEAAPDAGAPAAGGDTDFSLPGIDDIDLFAGSSGGAKTGGAAKTASAAEAPEEVEEIQLNDEELSRLQKTLAGYPLNLRIACEELIVEQAVAPDLMSKLIKLLVKGAPAKETAALAGKILGKTIAIPRGFEKSTGEALEAEQASFAYIFVHKFLPVLRLVMMLAVVAASLGYLIFKFIYTPLKAESIYKLGYERIFAGEYQRANERFTEAFNAHRKKDWFYKYAEAFRDERQYIYAEQKYDELLRYYRRDKKGILDYAAMETYYLRNYAKAETLLRRELLDFAPNDREGLLALGDNSLAWGEVDPSKYEDARFSYARLLDKYGWTDPVVERMMKYFIRTDNLKEVLPLQSYFMDNKKRKIAADSLAELGGYLLDKKLEEVRGVPNEYVERIEGIRDILLRAVKADPSLPEPHYHLSRYYHDLGNTREEQFTLETAIDNFNRAPEESVRRLNYRIDAHRRYADILINSRKFFDAEEQLVKGVNLYEDALARRIISRSPGYGRLYASLGDLEYFTKAGNWETALGFYHRAGQNGWAPPEIQYRMGAAYYNLRDWRNALEYFFHASSSLPLNRRLLFALGNASYERGDFFAAQGYYNRLLDILEAERSRLPVLLPNDRPEFLELAERLMMARNNAGAASEALAERTGNRSYRARAMGLYAEAARAWDSFTRNPESMTRSRPAPNAPGVSIPYLNVNNALRPQPGYAPEIFIRIDKDVLEPSEWERLAPLSH
jgi:tetratricopeptide (TPR) repeat protein